MRKRRLPSLLTEAKATAEAFRVKRGSHGYNVWRFWPWEHRYGGFHIVAANLRTHEDAWVWVLSHLKLTDEQPAEPKKVPAIVYGYPIWDIYGGS